MKIFILEDDHMRIDLFWDVLKGHDVTLAKNIEEARKKWLGPYDLALLDHDLGGQVFVDSEHENTGAQFVRDLIKNECLLAKVFIVHSWNPDGSRIMRDLLDEAGSRVYRQEFGSGLLAYLKGLKNGSETGTSSSS